MTDGTRDWQPRPIELLRKTLSMLCNYVWTKQLRPGEHLWSIPVDKARDFDCILSDAISELETLRAAGPGAAPRPTNPLENLAKQMAPQLEMLADALRHHAAQLRDPPRPLEENEKACDQCGWIPSAAWTSKRCGSLPFGSCDGTVEWQGTQGRAAPVEAPQPRQRTENKDVESRVDLSAHEQATGSTAPTNEPRSNFYKLWMACRMVLNELEAFDIAEDTVRWFDERQLLSHALERARAEVFAVDPAVANVGKAPLRATDSSSSPAVAVVAAGPDDDSHLCEFCDKTDKDFEVSCFLEVCPDCWKKANDGSGWMQRCYRVEAELARLKTTAVSPELRAMLGNTPLPSAENRRPDGDGPLEHRHVSTETTGAPQGSTKRTPRGAGSEPADSHSPAVAAGPNYKEIDEIIETIRVDAEHDIEGFRGIYKALIALRARVAAAGPPDALHALIEKWRTSAQRVEEPSNGGGGGAGTMTLDEVIALQVVERVRVSESQTLIGCADELAAVLRASPAPDDAK